MARNVRRGSTAWEAAGKVHGDIQAGFIRAEVVAWDDLVAAGGYAGARDRGKLRLEGRDYVMRRRRRADREGLDLASAPARPRSPSRGSRRLDGVVEDRVGAQAVERELERLGLAVGARSRGGCRTTSRWCGASTPASPPGSRPIRRSWYSWSRVALVSLQRRRSPGDLLHLRATGRSAPPAPRGGGRGRARGRRPARSPARPPAR